MKIKRLGFAIIVSAMLTSCGLLRPSYEYSEIPSGTSETTTNPETSQDKQTSEPIPTTLPTTVDPTSEPDPTTVDPTSEPEPTTEPDPTSEPTTGTSTINPEYEVEMTDINDSLFYYTDLSTNYSLPSVYFKGYGDIPFIELSYGLPFVGITADVENNAYIHTYTLDKNTKIVVDCSLDTINFQNYEKIMSDYYSDKYGITICPTVSSYGVYLDETKSTFQGPNNVMFNFKDYNIDLISYGEYCYIPFQIYDELFLNPAIGAGTSYNGDDFYVNYASFMKSGNELTEYGEAFYNGSNAQKGEKTQVEADFFYNSLCFKFDHFYGLKDWKNFNHIDDVITSMGIKNDLKSTSQSLCDYALLKLIRQYIDDGHSSFAMMGNYQYYDAEVESQLKNSVETGPRVYNLVTTRNGLTDLRDYYGQSADSYTIHDDMLVIRFDSFYTNTYDLYTLKTYSDEYVRDINYAGVWGLFYDALENAKADSNVKKVVIDASINGGGEAYNLIQLLGFLSRDVQLNYYHTISKTYHNLYYQVDTNLDNVLDEKDSYSNDFEFYILTSNFSFSCGNAFPTFAKAANSAKIIGETSGGGSCIVYNTAFADGTSIQMSGYSRLSYVNNKGKIISNEDGITPDIHIDRSYWYNYDMLRTFLD